ncbi:RepB family DNA primase [Aeromonas phage Gekk3-15]
MKSLKDRMAEAKLFLTELSSIAPEDERLIICYLENANSIPSDPKNADGTMKRQNWGGRHFNDNATFPVGKNAYVTTASYKKTAHSRTGVLEYRRHGRKGIGAGLALMIDDVGTGSGAKGEVPLSFLFDTLRPSAVVETSKDNYQVWYFFKEPVLSETRFQAFLDGFKRSIIAPRGGEGATYDVARYGRMPWGVNNKRGADGKFRRVGPDGLPFEVNLKFADYTKRYTLLEICMAFGFTFTEYVPKVEEAPSVEDLLFDKMQFDQIVKILKETKQGEGGAEPVFKYDNSSRARILCPWGDEHGGGDASGAFIAKPDASVDRPKFTFYCMHDSCKSSTSRREVDGDTGRTWVKFSDKLISEWIEGVGDRLNSERNIAIFEAFTFPK